MLSVGYRMDNRAIDIYVRALLDIVNVLEQQREVRTGFDAGFLARILRDGFLQTLTESDKDRILQHSRCGEEFLLWKGPPSGQKMNWNVIGWIFPFYSDEEIENSYEIITRAELNKRSWAALRQFVLSCRLRFQETSLDIPTNLVKVRVTGDECRAAMDTLEIHPPNLRYVANALLNQLPASSYLRKCLRIELVVGEKLEPYIHPIDRHSYK